MYIDNVRNVIREFDRVEYDAYLMRLHRVLQERFNKNLKPSVLRMRVDEFKNGTNSSIEYFEAYLLAFDEIVAYGAIKVLQGRTLEMEHPWRPLMQRLRKNKSLSEESISHLQNERVNDELEEALYNILSYCSTLHTDQFLDNLQLFNQFLKIKNQEK